MGRSDRYKVPEDPYKEYSKTRKKAKRKKSKLRVVILVLVILMVMGGIAGGIYAAVCISQAPAINPNKMYDSLDLSSHIYDDEGEQVDTIYYSENRRIVSYKELPENLKNAFIAVEDKTFWKHHGFNFKRMVGAVLQSVIYRNGISGTSTITQQLARNVYLPEVKSERSIKRKIIEMYYAYKLEKSLSKEEILEGYLNTIYLGYGCYGVNSAAKTYFNRELKDLTLEQCAALAALPQAPDQYALLKNEEGDKCTKIEKGLYANDVSCDRRNLILSLMCDQGYITEQQQASAEMPLSTFIDPGVSTSGVNSRSYFKDYLIDCVVKDLVEKRGKTEQEALNMVYSKGLKIYSTLDSNAQKVIVKEFKKDNNFPNTVKGKKPEAAMVIVDVKTGAIKAMAGGRKPKGEKLFNRAINYRQPGSSIKPLTVYGAALQKSLELAEKNQVWKYYNYNFDSLGNSGFGRYITTSSIVIDAPMKVNGKNWPKNAGGGYSGTNTFRTAIQQSINTCAVKIQMQVGNEYSADMLDKFGITSIVKDRQESYNDMNPASLALGGLTKGVSPLEMALAYAAFPNGGVRNTGYCYTKVLDKNGNVLLENKSEQFKVMDEGVAWIMTDVLQSVVSKGIAGGAAIKGEKAGGKTGTTSDQYDIWFDGFTPNYSGALWIGSDKNVSLTSMSGPAASLWGKIMSQIDKAKGGKYLEKPDNVIKVNGNYYTKGTEPREDETVKTIQSDNKDKEKSKDKDKKKD